MHSKSNTTKQCFVLFLFVAYDSMITIRVVKLFKQQEGAMFERSKVKQKELLKENKGHRVGTSICALCLPSDFEAL